MELFNRQEWPAAAIPIGLVDPEWEPDDAQEGLRFYCSEYDKNGYTCEQQCDRCAKTDGQEVRTNED